jgi:hypothetical protein
MRSFARYWPVLGAAYDVYLNHPRAAREEALRLYLARDDVMTSVLTEDEAGAVFERAWSRIRDSEGAADRFWARGDSRGRSVRLRPWPHRGVPSDHPWFRRVRASRRTAGGYAPRHLPITGDPCPPACS